MKVFEIEYMNIKNKVRILKLALDGLLQQRAEAHQMSTEAIWELQDDIEDYFKLYLPKHNQIYGSSVIKYMKDITEDIFKNIDSPKRNELEECMKRLSIAANFIPEEQRNM